MKINRTEAPQKMTAAPAANFAKEPRAKQEKSGEGATLRLCRIN